MGNVKFRINELLYFTGFFFLSFSTIVLSGSFVARLLPQGSNMAAKVLCVVFFMFSMMKSTWKVKELFAWGIICFSVIAVSLIIDKDILIAYFLAIFAGMDIDFEKIKKFVISMNIFCVVLVVGLCMAGLIPNLVFSHETTDSKSSANSLGFLYYSNLSIIIFMVSTLLFTLKKPVFRSWPVILAVLAANYMIYKVTTTRLTFILIAIEIVLMLLISKYNILHIRNNRFWRAVSTGAFAVSAVFCLVFSYMYNPSISWMRSLNKLLKTRLRYSYEGLHNYGWSLFGKKIEMVGGTDIANGSAKEYFYIDSGYVYAFLAYGIIIFTLLIIGYSIVFRYSVVSGDKALFVCCTLICVYSLINNIVINLSLNPFLILSASILARNLHRPRKKAIRIRL